MKRTGIFALLTVCALLQALVSAAQVDTVFATQDSMPERKRIAIFTPLYLDSAFDASGNYRYAKSFPKFINSGLEFWEGAQLAIDSLRKEGLKAEVFVYDTRASRKPFPEVINSPEVRSMHLLIGHVNINESAQLAQLASQMNVPFINVNLPNEAGVSNNPNYVMLSSTLMTHCTGIYKFLQRNYSVSNIIVFRKKGIQEDRLKTYFTEVEKNTAAIPLKLKYIDLTDNFTAAQLQPYLDSNKTNVVLSGSLDAGFGLNLAQQLATLSSSYTTTLFGMPTWDVLDFQKTIYKGIEIIYSTPFYINPDSRLVSATQDHFRRTFYSRPSDMLYRGYETVYHFAHLLQLHGANLGSSLGDKKYSLFSEMDIQPVLDKSTMTLEYFENKKLYFVKKVDGVVKAIY
ncbi:amino acid ABC transporter substrate-binding protein [Pseudoflavitalea sp. G-6-1-2]|uniref:hypothetical protein n=1 Tax=Pseudoflavitalea sp. G-6-1-2 TaxID=2728841 RepID=UPI00146BDC9E|nr:hypothetical protein [Pseudoflavitalea sp. G-6-1-2]NML22794.1 amino acid ABC transporter substrate-binding protein [Pseudoflavitalea sp. G-6-1-2]